MTFRQRLLRFEATVLATKTWPEEWAKLSKSRMTYLIRRRAKNLILTAPAGYESDVVAYVRAMQNMAILNVRERFKDSARLNKIAGNNAGVALKYRAAVHNAANMEFENVTDTRND